MPPRIELAHAFEQADFRHQVINAVKSKSKGFSRVGFPAVLGIQQHREVVADLEKQLGKPVFEISALPPSVPGRRLYEALKRLSWQPAAGLLSAVRLLMGPLKTAG